MDKGTKAGGRPERPRRHRWLRRLGITALALAGLILLALIGGYAYLTSKAGGERLRRLALESANAQLSGSLELQGVEYHGNRIVLLGVTLRDPEGEVVAEVKRVEVAVSLGQLVHRRIDVTEAVLDTPRLYLKQDERGLNLARAVASKKPKTEKAAKSEKKSTLSLAVDALALEHGFIDFEQSSGTTERTVRLEELGGRGHLRLDGGGERLEAGLTLGSKLTEPVEGPFELKLSARGEGERRTADVSLTAAGAKVQAVARMDGAEKAHVRVDELRVGPETARAFVPSWPLTAPVTLEGDVDKAGDFVTARLDAKAASATASVDGAFDLAAKRSPGVTVALRGVDLSELIENGPRSDVKLDLKAEGGGTSLDTLDARVRLDVPESQMAGHPFGPVRLRANTKDGRFDVLEFFAQVPGLSANAAGGGTREHLALQGHVTATDLALLGRTLGKLAGPEGLPVSGQGKLDFAVSGSLSHPGAVAQGAFPSLRYQDKEVRSLSFLARVPDVKSPLDARLRLDAASVAAGDKRFTRVHAAVDGAGRQLRVDAEAHGYADLGLRLTGLVDEDRKGLGLSDLELRYPEATWRLTGPARISFRGQRVAVEHLALRSGRQTLSVDGAKEGNHLRAAVDVEALNLARLPKAFVPRELNLAGGLTARVRAEGTAKRPRLQARVELRGGRVKEYSNLSFTLDGAYAKDRATGTLVAQGVGAKLDASFDVPVKALRAGRREPVRVDAHIAELNVEDALDALGRKLPLSGFATAELHVTGTAEDPAVDARAYGRAVRYRQLPPTDLALAFGSGAGGKLGARLEWTLLDRRSRVELDTPFTAAALLRHPPKKDALMRAPIALTADVRELPLPLLYTAGLMSREVLGTVSLQASAHGTALAPVGEVRAALDGLTTGDMRRPVDVVVNLTSGEDGLQAEAVARQEGRAVLNARAKVEAGVAKLRDIRALAGAPLSIDADLGPLALADIQPLAEPMDVPGPKPKQLHGAVRAHFTAAGTLNHPRLQVRSTLDGLCTEGTTVGDIQLAYDYADARHVLDVLMRSANGGQLRLAARSRLDVSYPALTQHKPDVAAAPLSAELTSQNFDLSFLSGLTPQLRTIAGELRANGRVTGTVGAPRVQGDVEWLQGRLALLDYGEYHDIHLKLTGNSRRIELQELAAKGGQGSAKLSALAERLGDRFVIRGKADLDRFPIFTQDQLLANVSVRADAQGNASAERIIIRRLHIPEAHIELPDVKRKNLQKLDEAQDVVLVRNGVPLKSEKPEHGVGGAGTAGTETGSPKRTIVVNVDAPRNVWLKGNDVNTEIGLSDNFRLEMGRGTHLFGEVRVIRGRVEVFGRKFDLQNDSKVTFTGPVTKPELDVTALHNNEREQIKVALHVTGAVGALKLEPSSTPPLPESEIYTLIATGRPTLQSSGGSTVSPTGQAASLLGSLAANELKKVISSNLPLDVLSIEAGDEGVTGTKVEAGTYLGDRLYIGYTGRIGVDPTRNITHENSNAVRLEYQLSKRWSFEGEYGDARAGNADLIWKKEY